MDAKDVIDELWADNSILEADRDALHNQRDAVIAERDAARAQCVAAGAEVMRLVADLGDCQDERDALRAALVSVIDGKSEFDIEYDTGMPTDEAHRIINLAYNRK